MQWPVRSASDSEEWRGKLISVSQLEHQRVFLIELSPYSVFNYVPCVSLYIAWDSRVRSIYPYYRIVRLTIKFDQHRQRYQGILSDN
jgi:hypothetical protein